MDRYADLFGLDEDLPSPPTSDLDRDSSDLSSLLQPLTLAPFRSPSFSPTSFLLSHRHTDLADLRAELDGLEEEVRAELGGLIERDYGEFVGLGRSLGGVGGMVGEVKGGLEEVKAGVEGIATRLKTTVDEIDRLLAEKAAVRADMKLARLLMGYAQALGELETDLRISSPNGVENHVNDSAESNTSLHQLQVHAESFTNLTYLRQKIPQDHPFSAACQSRFNSVETTLMADLAAGLREAAKSDTDKTRLMGILKVYRELGKAGEATGVLQSIR
ncbi:hypothetical protein YB2330_000975 [Saitoella coloradoensis]